MIRALLAVSLLLASLAPCRAQEEPLPDTIMGLSYGKAAVVTAAVIAGAVAINALVAPNVGTILAALYLGHFVAEAAVVISGAGASWGLGWWEFPEASAASAD